MNEDLTPKDLVPSSENLPALTDAKLPEIVSRAGSAAVFAADEFFYGKIRNEHTRSAYLIAVRRFLRWAEARQLELVRIAPRDVGQYLDEVKKLNLSVATRKQHLAAIRHFFDGLVTRHAILLNPALSVRGERYQVVEGKTPEVTVKGAREILATIKIADAGESKDGAAWHRPLPVGLRDRAIIGILIYTAARAGAVAKLQRKHFYHAGDQYMLHFEEKGGKSREIPVRHDLQQMIEEYLHVAGFDAGPKDAPLFRTAYRKTHRLTEHAMNVKDVCRMVKRRMRDAGLPRRLSPHSFRVTTITDLLEQGVPLEDVQRLAGHADPRTTRLYDRRQKRITRNIVERISV